MNALKMNVRLNKNFATCRNNFHRYFVEAKDFSALLQRLISEHIFLLFEMDCEFEDVLDVSSQHLDMLSFSLWPGLNGERHFID